MNKLIGMVLAFSLGAYLSYIGFNILTLPFWVVIVLVALIRVNGIIEGEK